MIIDKPNRIFYGCIVIALNILLIAQLLSKQFLWPIFIAAMLLMLLFRSRESKFLCIVCIFIVYVTHYESWCRMKAKMSTSYFGLFEAKAYDMWKTEDVDIKGSSLKILCAKNSKKEKLDAKESYEQTFEKESIDFFRNMKEPKNDLKNTKTAFINPQTDTNNETKSFTQSHKPSDANLGSYMIVKQNNNIESIKSPVLLQNIDDPDLVLMKKARINDEKKIKSILAYEVSKKETFDVNSLQSKNKTYSNIITKKAIITKNQLSNNEVKGEKRIEDTDRDNFSCAFLVTKCKCRTKTFDNRKYVFFYFLLDNDIIEELLLIKTSKKKIAIELSDESGNFFVHIAETFKIKDRENKYQFTELILYMDEVYIANIRNNVKVMRHCDLLKSKLKNLNLLVDLDISFKSRGFEGNRMVVMIMENIEV